MITVRFPKACGPNDGELNCSLTPPYPQLAPRSLSWGAFLGAGIGSFHPGAAVGSECLLIHCSCSILMLGGGVLALRRAFSLSTRASAE